MRPLSRRRFLGQATAGTVGMAWAAGLAWGPRVLGANNRIVLAVMGTNGRGSDLAAGFLKLDGVEIAVVCDVDERALAKGVQTVVKAGGREPRGVRDVRRALDDRSVDALVVATPDHWHGPATILACNAGKHVYVEKPASHNPQEGEWMLAAARRHRRVVQVGMQRRSMPQVIEAIERVRSGVVGNLRFSRGWYTNTRGSIGRGRVAPVPDGLDWALWQGPAPERPFRDNLVHYHWHWFWHWGTGELGNNGIHALDLCRWGLGVDFPRRVVSGGGRYHFPDDQETPDTQVVTFEFGDRAITWEGRSCQRHGIEGSGFGVSFHGDQGTLVTDGTGYRVYDAADKEIQKVAGSGGDAPHLQDFLEAIRSDRRPRGDIEEAHRSTLLCHLGNIAWRTTGAVTCDPRTGHVTESREARKLWRREYRKGWEPRP